MLATVAREATDTLRLSVVELTNVVEVTVTSPLLPVIVTASGVPDSKLLPVTVTV